VTTLRCSAGRAVSGEPHESQKRASSRFAIPHAAQITVRG
jgi:hypothetical protein